MNADVTLQMERNYPNISSGTVSFRNARTGTEVNIKAPKDLKDNIYGIKSITMDTGVGYTIFPMDFAGKIDVERPAEDEGRYYIFSGIGGTSIGFVSLDRVIVRVEDDKSELERAIYPFFLARYAPSITSEGRLLASPEYQPYTKEVIRFISPPFQYRSDYVVEVSSPDEEFSPQGRRLKLEVDIGEEIDYILIGRDWQKGFQIVFETEEMGIKEQER